MEYTYHPNGGVATPALIATLLQDQGKWAHDLLCQCYAMPKHVRTALLNGEAEWQIPNEKTLIITLAASP